MRTTIDLPDSLYRQIKSRAALEGRPVKALVQALLQRGLAATDAGQVAAQARSAPPTVSIAAPMCLQEPSNAGLFELLDDTR